MSKVKLMDLLNSNKIYFHLGDCLDAYLNNKPLNAPVSLEIHPTQKCNHRCVHCSYKERNETRLSIEPEIMTNLIQDVISMKIKAVYFSGGGEPTFYPGLKQHIVKLTDNGVEVSILTNGSYFVESDLISIADKLNYIAVSVPACNENDFLKITEQNNYNKVIALPNQIKEKHKDNAPIIGSRIVITNQNFKNIGCFLEEIKKAGFDYALFKIVRDYENNGVGLTPENEKELKEIVEKISNIDSDFTNIQSVFQYRKPFSFEGTCFTNNLGLLAAVDSDGKVYPNIVEIGDENFCLGNLKTNSLIDIWNSEQHNIVRVNSDKKWENKECKNCRAISYNLKLRDMFNSIPNEYDAFL